VEGGFSVTPHLKLKENTANTETAHPKVGIFYVYNNQLYVDNTTLLSYLENRIEPPTDMRHEIFWNKLKVNPVLAAVSNRDYQFLPRGRVMLLNVGGKQICQITLCDCLRANESLLERIKNEFDVGGLKVVFSNNANHYKCFDCRKGKVATVKSNTIEIGI
jgi:hypothetical protein